jgi:hypothetical protein
VALTLALIPTLTLAPTASYRQVLKASAAAADASMLPGGGAGGAPGGAGGAGGGANGGANGGAIGGAIGGAGGGAAAAPDEAALALQMSSRLPKTVRNCAQP